MLKKLSKGEGEAEGVLGRGGDQTFNISAPKGGKYERGKELF